MGRKRFTAERIINMLREAEVLLNQDSTVGEVCRKRYPRKPMIGRTCKSLSYSP